MSILVDNIAKAMPVIPPVMSVAAEAGEICVLAETSANAQLSKYMPPTPVAVSKTDDTHGVDEVPGRHGEEDDRSSVIVFPKGSFPDDAFKNVDLSSVRMRTARNIWRYRVVTKVVGAACGVMGLGYIGVSLTSTLAMGAGILPALFAIPAGLMFLSAYRGVRSQGAEGLRRYKADIRYYRRPFASWLDRFKADLFLLRKNIISFKDVKRTIESGRSPGFLRLPNHAASVKREHLAEYIKLLGKEPWLARVLTMLEEAGNENVDEMLKDK